MDLIRLTHPDLILLDLPASDARQAIQQLGARFVAQGLTAPEYVEAVVAREDVFPTGLPTGEIAVAIPHAAAEYVHRSALGVAVLREATPFGVMGSPGEKVDVKIVFLLAIQGKESQVPALQQLIALFQNGSTLKKIAAATTNRQVCDILLADLVESQEAP